MLITGLVLAALLLALYGVMFGTGADWCSRSRLRSRSPCCRSWASQARCAGWHCLPA